MKSRQSGNVLFLILIAVALFAALSYAVTLSSRGGGNNTAKESASTGAARVFNFETALRAAITRLMTIHGIDIFSLSFNNDIYKSINGTLIFSAMGTPVNPSFYVFHPQGGSVSPQIFPDISIPCPTCAAGLMAPGHLNIQFINVPDVGTATADLSAGIFNLNKDVCLALNEKNGISFIPVANVTFANFEGTTSIPAVAPASGVTSADLDAIKGKTSFCFLENTSTNRYIYRMILQVN